MISDMVQRKLEKMRYVGTDAKGINEGPPVMASQGGTEVRYGQTSQQVPVKDFDRLHSFLFAMASLATRSVFCTLGFHFVKCSL